MLLSAAYVIAAYGSTNYSGFVQACALSAVYEFETSMAAHGPERLIELDGRLRQRGLVRLEWSRGIVTDYEPEQNRRSRCWCICQHQEERRSGS
jgi:hypothetical protein